MTGGVRRAWGDSENALIIVLVAGLLLVLSTGLPGQLSTDTIIGIEEGTTGTRVSWGPVAYSWLVGAAFSKFHGLGPFATVTALLLFVSLLSIPRLRERTSWAAAPTALAICLLPQVLIFQSIVWKDILFANATIAGFFAMAFAVRQEPGRKRLMYLVLSASLFTLGSLVRQNGILVVAAAALALAWALRKTARRPFATAALFFAACFVGVQVINSELDASFKGDVTSSTSIGFRIMEQYDIVGMVSQDPSIDLAVIRAAAPNTAEIVRQSAAIAYSPVRSERLGVAPQLGVALWVLPYETIAAQWRALVFNNPRLYLHNRLDVFRWVFSSPDITKCLPAFSGIDGPPSILAHLGYAAGRREQDRAMLNYATHFFRTPAYSHLTFAVIALAVTMLLLRRRSPVDIVISGMMIGALGFAASFYFIAIACDYRYIYFLDIAALSGLLYVVADYDWQSMLPERWRRPLEARSQ